jgi:hypothetical protein
MSHAATLIFRKAVILLCTLIIWLAFAFVMYSDGYYYRHAPRQPDPSSGRVYPHYVKTLRDVARVYVTRTEKLPSELLFPVIMASGLCAYLLNQRWKVFQPVRQVTLKKVC